MIPLHLLISISRRSLTSCRHKVIVSVLCFVVGLLGASFTVNQYYYSRLMTAGWQAIQENRFDTLAFVKAGKLWFARQDNILFNQGLLAYKAGNLTHAAQLFRDALQHSRSDQLRTFATYNLANVMQDLGETEGARALFEETLRLDAENMEAKFNLEQIQRQIRQQEGEIAQATLQRHADKPLLSHPAMKRLRRGKGI
jgi:tetratricopeptide (TPR) repeat protein